MKASSAAWWMGAGLGLLALGACQGAGEQRAEAPRDGAPIVVVADIDYPETQTVEQVDTLHGVEVADPYRWLEDDQSEATRLWIEAQNDVTFEYLEEIPGRSAILSRLESLQDYERYGVPFKEGGRYFYSRNDGLQDQSVLYTTRSLDVEPQVLLDPNEWSEEGTVSLASYSVSRDGSHIAYGVSEAGSDWVTFRVKNIETGEVLSDEVEWVKFSGAAWHPSGDGFYYSRYDEPEEGEAYSGANYYQKLFYHEVGADQAQDRLIYERPDQKDLGLSAGVTDDGEYLAISIWQGTSRKNGFAYRELRSPGAPIVELLTDFDAQYSLIGSDGPIFWFLTDLDAPLRRVIEIDIRDPERSNWRTIIPEGDSALTSASVVGRRIVAEYLVDAKSQVMVFDTEGNKVRDVALPGIGSASGFGGDLDDPETFFAFSGFTTPTEIHRYNVRTGERELFRKPDVDFDPQRYETRQVFYRSRDGERIPMFIIHRKGLRRTGDNPTILYGYGGFNISMTPSFSTSRIAWLEMGGVYAVANLRGGGEYGKEWHDAGKLLNKQNVFDDFIAAGEWLIENRYTSSRRLAISGRSNGGLLVGACMTQRPDLWGACLPGVGVMDMLRFHKFTIGWAWTSDYGSPDEPEHFRNLFAYSPYHNLEEGVCYPPTLITTADTDDRVVPAHSFKFAARLQEVQGCDNPVLIRIETSAGHGGGKPVSKALEERADEFAFLTRVFEMDVD